MAMKQMTMHMLLAELKTYEDRIAKALKGNFVASIKGVTSPEEIIEATSKIQSAYDSITHLIANKKTLEAARVESNQITKVIIGGKEYTVAEAIKRKYDIKYDKMLLEELQGQLNASTMNTNNNNRLIEKQKTDYALKALEVMYKSINNEEEIANIDRYAELSRLEQKFVTDNTNILLDPLKLQAKIEKLSKEITNFEIEVDAQLSVSNATTYVTVDYLD